MDTIPIVLACNDFYVPYMSVVLTSIVENANSIDNFIFLILHRDITKTHIETLKNQFEINNFKIDFYNITEYLTQYENLYISNHIKIETYFRLLAGDLFPQYDKVLYIDCDIVVETDIAELYNIDVEGYYLAGTRDADNAAIYLTDQQRKDYSDNVLEINPYYDYLQAGVIIMNLQMIRKDFTAKSLLDVAISRNWNFHDQDVLNYLCKGKIKIIDYAWNFVFDLEEHWQRSTNVISSAPHFVYEEYIKAKKNPKIIHFSWFNKPWHSPGIHLGYRFWHYARLSPFYTTILFRTEEDLSNWFYYEKFLKR